VPADIDTEALKKMVIKSGVPEVVANMMDKVGLYNYAVERKLIAAPDDETGG
jgi:hypothetical protein